jgi:hypothetical protein
MSESDVQQIDERQDPPMFSTLTSVGFICSAD